MSHHKKEVSDVGPTRKKVHTQSISNDTKTKIMRAPHQHHNQRLIHSSKNQANSQADIHSDNLKSLYLKYTNHKTNNYLGLGHSPPNPFPLTTTAAQNKRTEILFNTNGAISPRHLDTDNLMIQPLSVAELGHQIHKYPSHQQSQPLLRGNEQIEIISNRASNPLSLRIEDPSLKINQLIHSGQKIISTQSGSSTTKHLNNVRSQPTFAYIYSPKSQVFHKNRKFFHSKQKHSNLQIEGKHSHIFSKNEKENEKNKNDEDFTVTSMLTENRQSNPNEYKQDKPMPPKSKPKSTVNLSKRAKRFQEFKARLEHKSKERFKTPDEMSSPSKTTDNRDRLGDNYDVSSFQGQTERHFSNGRNIIKEQKRILGSSSSSGNIIPQSSRSALSKTIALGNVGTSLNADKGSFIMNAHAMNKKKGIMKGKGKYTNMINSGIPTTKTNHLQYYFFQHQLYTPQHKSLQPLPMKSGLKARKRRSPDHSSSVHQNFMGKQRIEEINENIAIPFSDDQNIPYDLGRFEKEKNIKWKSPRKAGTNNIIQILGVNSAPRPSKMASPRNKSESDRRRAFGKQLSFKNEVQEGGLHRAISASQYLNKKRKKNVPETKSSSGQRKSGNTRNIGAKNKADAHTMEEQASKTHKRPNSRQNSAENPRAVKSQDSNNILFKHIRSSIEEKDNSPKKEFPINKKYSKELMIIKKKMNCLISAFKKREEELLTKNSDLKSEVKELRQMLELQKGIENPDKS